MIYFVFAINLLITSVVEGTTIFLLYKKWNLVYYSLLCNLLTNPVMNLLLLVIVKTFGVAYYNISLIILETMVVLVEAYIYKMLGNMKMPKALLLSLFLNLLSYLCGLLIR